MEGEGEEGGGGRGSEGEGGGGNLTSRFTCQHKNVRAAVAEDEFYVGVTVARGAAISARKHKNTVQGWI